MILLLNSRSSLIAAVSLLLPHLLTPCAFGDPAETPSHSTDASATNAAAVVDGHVIPMDEVVVTCVRNHWSEVVDQLIQGYVADREAARRGIKIDEAEIDKKIAQLRTSLAPETLENTLKQHQMTMEEARARFRQKMEARRLVADQVKPAKLVHCREILIRYGPGSQGGLAAGRTEVQALALIDGIQEQLKTEKDFGKLAARFSETENNGKPIDLGIVRKDSMIGLEAPVQEAALKLSKGQRSEVIKSDTGYHILEAVSTGDDHPASENEAYRKAAVESNEWQAGVLETENIIRLIESSKKVFADESDFVVGKPLPEAAVVIDGHPILMKDVAHRCVADGGRKTTNIMVQNYVVDRECERRGIKISEAAIDARIEKLRKDIAPMTLDEGLKMHHTTLEKLRYDFRQEMERTRLAVNRVPPAKLVHARVILIKAVSNDASPTAPGSRRTDAEAKALAADILKQSKAGKSFEALVSQYSEGPEKDKGGDMGILYEGKNGIETAILDTALKMSADEISPEAVRGLEGYFIVQAVSTDERHDTAEDPLYSAGLEEYKNSRAGTLATEIIRELLSQSKIVYYLE